MRSEHVSSIKHYDEDNVSVHVLELKEGNFSDGTKFAEPMYVQMTLGDDALYDKESVQWVVQKKDEGLATDDLFAQLL